MDLPMVDDWLAAYMTAWRSYDPEAIGQLFTKDAEYRYHPWDEPIRGRDAIVSSWLDARDEPGTYYAAYSAIAMERDVAVATGTSTYLDEKGEVDRVFHNCFVMSFDSGGRCRSFTEMYMQEPRPSS